MSEGHHHLGEALPRAASFGLKIHSHGYFQYSLSAQRNVFCHNLSRRFVPTSLISDSDPFFHDNGGAPSPTPREPSIATVFSNHLARTRSPVGRRPRQAQDCLEANWLTLFQLSNSLDLGLSETDLLAPSI